jgi:hypothetical protein
LAGLDPAIHVFSIASRRLCARLRGIAWQNDVAKYPYKRGDPEQTYKEGVSKAQEALIGRTIVAWSRLERAIEEVIWAFLGLTIEEGRIITARLDVNFKLNMAQGLAERHLSAEEYSDFCDLLNRVRDIHEIRNVNVHGHWITVLPEKLPGAMSLKEKLPNDTARNEVITTILPEETMLGIIRNIMLGTNLMIDLRRKQRALHDKSAPPPEKGQ